MPDLSCTPADCVVPLVHCEVHTHVLRRYDAGRGRGRSWGTEVPRARCGASRARRTPLWRRLRKLARDDPTAGHAVGMLRPLTWPRAQVILQLIALQLEESDGDQRRRQGDAARIGRECGSDESIARFLGRGGDDASQQSLTGKLLYISICIAVLNLIKTLVVLYVEASGLRMGLLQYTKCGLRPPCAPPPPLHGASPGP